MAVQDDRFDALDGEALVRDALGRGVGRGLVRILCGEVGHGVLTLAGEGFRDPELPAARYGLGAVAGVLLIVSVMQLLGLPGPPS